MELLIGIVLFVLFIGGGGTLLAFTLLGGMLRQEKKAAANATQILDTAFDGREHVTINAGMGTLPFDTVIAGGRERGYTLTHQAGDPTRLMTLMFEKA